MYSLTQFVLRVFKNSFLTTFSSCMFFVLFPTALLTFVLYCLHIFIPLFLSPYKYMIIFYSHTQLNNDRSTIDTSFFIFTAYFSTLQ